MTKDRSSLMVRVSGAYTPAVVPRLSVILLQHGVEVLEVQQTSIQGFLGYHLLLDLDHHSSGSDNLLKDLLFEAHALNLQLEFRFVFPAQTSEKKRRFVLTHFGGTRVLAALSAILFEEGVHIESMATFSHHGSRSMEMVLDFQGASREVEVKKRLTAKGRELQVGLGIQKMEAFRKNKRIIFFDMDSTLVDMEVMDEMARARGVYREVARVTERAMRGELDFEESLIQRAALLKGLEVTEMERIRDSLPLNPGVKELITTLQWLGYRIGIVTGGFDFFADHLKQRLGLDYAFANHLEIESQTLTGRVLGEIVDAAGKAKIVNQTTCDLGISLDQTVVVGDGANDALMLAQAGLGIAYNGKKRLEQVATASLGPAPMTDILHLLGITEEDIHEAMACRPVHVR